MITDDWYDCHIKYNNANHNVWFLKLKLEFRFTVNDKKEDI